MKTCICLKPTRTPARRDPPAEQPPERIPLNYSPVAGMLFLPKNNVLEQQHPRFWRIFGNYCRVFGTDRVRAPGEAAELDAALVRFLSDNFGMTLETDDVALLASLLGLDRGDPVFKPASPHGFGHLSH